jgi:hypothetical protein
MVLEDVALDAVVEDGRLVARTSARRLAEQLRIDPGTAANALRQLRHRGLLALERDPGPAGRFGLAVYVLGDVDGLAVVAPNGVGPLMADAVMVRPRVVEPDVGSTGKVGLEATTVANPPGQPMLGASRAAAARRRKGSSASVELAGQVVLDLGLGTA